MTVSVQGPSGYPKALYGSFAGKPAYSPPRATVSLLGAAGYPREPYGSFAGKPTYVPAETSSNNPYLAHVGRLMGRF